MVVNVSLGDTQLFLHTEFHGQSVGVPACLAVHLVALHGLIAVKGILDAAGQHVVNSGMTICRGRSFKKDKLGTSLAFLNTTPEDIVLLPRVQHVVIHLG